MPGFKMILLSKERKEGKYLYEIWTTPSDRAGYSYKVTSIFGLILGRRKTRFRHLKTYTEVVDYLDAERIRAERDGYTSDPEPAKFTPVQPDVLGRENNENLVEGPQVRPRRKVII